MRNKSAAPERSVIAEILCAYISRINDMNYVRPHHVTALMSLLFCKWHIDDNCCASVNHSVIEHIDMQLISQTNSVQGKAVGDIPSLNSRIVPFSILQ